MEGVVLGTVKKNWDKDYPGQLQIEYSLAETGKGETKWIPVMTFYSGKKYGAYFLPEVNSKVVLAFLYGDKNCPIVLGCQMGGDNTLQSDTACDKNEKKRLSTKGGYQILFDEKKDNEKFSFSDVNGENTLEIDSQSGSLTVDLKTKMVLKFGTEAFLTVEKGVMTVEGDVTVKAKNLTFEVEENITVKGKNVSLEPTENVSVKPTQNISLAGSAVEINPSGDITLKGSGVKAEPSGNVELNGTQAKITPSASVTVDSGKVEVSGKTLELKANVSGKLEASGMLQVKGQMLKLN